MTRATTKDPRVPSRSLSHAAYPDIAFKYQQGKPLQ